MRSQFLVVVGATCVLFVASSVHAALVPGVTASTNMLWTNSTSVTNIVNGSGLPGNTPSLSGVHTWPNASNVWASGYKTGYVVFDMMGSVLLDGISVWAFNGDATIGARDIQLLVSTDGVAYTPIVGAPTLLAQGPWANQVAPQVFGFAPVTATHVRLDILTNYGHPSSSGFAEIQFSGTPVPEPMTITLLSLGGIALLRRKRSA